MEEIKQELSLKGTWPQALLTFFSPLVLFLILRWAIVEPFVIPSESMLPNLLIHDHILVKKSSFGLKIPFGNQWIFFWNQPERGDVVVFKYPINPKLYYIKRLIGRPGDHLKIRNGRIFINDVPAVYTPGEQQEIFQEEFDGKKHRVRFLYPNNSEIEEQSIDVPEDKYFVMGDNRDASSDSRVWGLVPKENLVGKAWMIWLSCDDTFTDIEFLCDPMKLRWSRFFKKIEGINEN